MDGEQSTSLISYIGSLPVTDLFQVGIKYGTVTDINSTIGVAAVWREALFEAYIILS